MRNLPTFILLILVLACSSNSGNEQATNPETTTTEQTAATSEPSKKPEPLDSAFAQFLELIPELKLPFETSCDGSYPSPDIDRELTMKYTKTDWHHPFRKIKTEQDYQLVLFIAPTDIELPIFYTFSNTGDTLATMTMFNQYCGADLGYYNKQYFKIDNQLNMFRYDSTWTYDFDENDEKIEGTDKLKASITKFRLSSDGLIREK